MRVAGGILQLHRQLKAECPRAAPPATDPKSWGTVGDAFHDPTSDHAPKDFSGWGVDIVTAGDFPDRPDLGLTAFEKLDNIRRSRDDRVKYGISEGQMFSSYPAHGYPAWTWRPGKGHYEHGHLSLVGDARADSQRPWQTGAADDMSKSWLEPITQGPPGVAGQQRDTALAFGWVHAHGAHEGVKRLEAAAAADAARDNATLAAVKALAVATGNDPAPILDAINGARAETLDNMRRLLAHTDRLETLVRRQAAAMAAAGVALDQADDEVT